jgi:hypothetical protein
MNRCELITALLLLPVFGCNMKGMQNGNSNGLEGDWALSVPFSQTPGTINFSGNKFKETFDMGNGVNAAELVISGDYTSDGKRLHLSNEEFQINKSVSFEAMTFRELIKKEMGADYAMEWSGNNVLYLTSSVVGSGAQASVVIGLSRNGGQVDQKKVAGEFTVTTGTTGSATFDSDNGGTFIPNQPNSSAQANNSPPPQNGSQQDQGQGQSQSQTQNTLPASPPSNDQNSQPQATQSQPQSSPTVQTSAPPQNSDQPPPQGTAGATGQ